MEEEYMENTDTDQAESEDTESYVDNETATDSGTSDADHTQSDTDGDQSSEAATVTESGETTETDESGENTEAGEGSDNGYSDEINALWEALNLEHETSMQNATSTTESLNLILSEIQQERTLADYRYQQETELAERYEEYYQHFYSGITVIGFITALLFGYLVGHGFWSRMKVG